MYIVRNKNLCLYNKICFILSSTLLFHLISIYFNITEKYKYLLFLSTFTFLKRAFYEALI